MKNLRRLVLIVVLLIGGGGFWGASAVHADTISISSALPGMTNVSGSPPGAWVSSFYNFALIASGILAFGAIVYGGILYAISAGNASKQSEGRSWIWSALIGLLLLAGAYIILNTVNPNLTNLTVTPLSTVNTTPATGH